MIEKIEAFHAANLQAFLAAMPEGSEWRVYNHVVGVDVGQVSVLRHRRIGVELYVHATQTKMTLPYPKESFWMVQEDHIRIGNKERGLVATYAPA